MNNEIKDFFLFACLMTLLFYGYQKMRTHINIHTNTLVHELDHNFVDRLYSVQRQSRVTQLITEGKKEHNSELSDALNAIIKSLADIETKYSSNSEGVMFLGPIGSTAIVLKEQELETRLLDIAKEIGRILSSLLGKFQVSEQAKNIDAIIAQNQNYISLLLKKNN